VVVGAAVVVPVVVGAAVVVRCGDAAAWAGKITDWTIGRVHDFGNTVARPVPATSALSTGRRFSSFIIRKSFSFESVRARSKSVNASYLKLR
jgi:hypothetical protein